MAWIDVRLLVRDSKGAWSDQVAGTVDTNPARWAIMSPLIVKRPHGPPSLASVMAETSLLLDHLVIRHGEPLRWSWRSRRSPTHLARFMTESLGLALAGDLAQLYGWHPGLAMMLDADDLPPHLKPKLAPPGFPRPDYLYWTPSGLRGGEARARSSPGPISMPRPAAVQFDKLQKLDKWAQQVSLTFGISPAWSMSWAWSTTNGTKVDLFDPGVPLELDAGDAFAAHHRRLAQALTSEESAGLRRRGVAMTSRQLVSGGSDDESGYWLSLCAWRGRADDVIGVVPLERPGDVQPADVERTGVAWSAVSPFMWAGITTAERGPVESPEQIVEIEGGLG